MLYFNYILPNIPLKYKYMRIYLLFGIPLGLSRIILDPYVYSKLKQDI